MKKQINVNNDPKTTHLKNKNRGERHRSMMFNIIIVLGILIVINLISINIFTRFDLSRGKIYSLSRSSRETVRELPDRLLIKAYFTKNLPAQLADAHRFTRDILSEYQAYSRGRIRFEFVDPSDEDHLRQEAQRNQVMPVSMRVVEDDKLEIREIFMGLVFHYQGNTETIPFIQNTRGLEYDITSSIKKITDIGRKTVGLFKIEEPMPPAMPGRQQPQTRFSLLSDMISDHYNLEQLDLTEPVSYHINTMIFAGVKDSLHIEQIYNLDQYLMRGGRLLLFQERVDANLQTMTANPIRSNLFDLLEYYGIRIKENLVTDANAGQIQVQRQQGIFSFATPVSYPPFPVISNVNKDHVVTRNLENLQMIFVSEIDRVANPSLDFVELLKTSENSGEIRGPQFDISFEKYMQQRDLRRMFNSPAKIVAGLYTGYIESFYLDMFPEEDDSLAEDFYYRTNDAKIILVADSEFIKDGAGAGAQANLDFVLNSVDYLMDDTTLIEIRARETVFKPLRELSTSGRKFVRWLNILLPSFLLLIFGAFNYQKQIRQRKLIRKIYEQE
ncbi:MAG: GldG family protein [Candidatus Cloacimonetes bacterium]|nr:GldG family protein [Candidatus Cloacimonadota bacterium]